MKPLWVTIAEMAEEAGSRLEHMDWDMRRWRGLLVAQVHATLAQAAATALGDDGGPYVPRRRAGGRRREADAPEPLTLDWASAECLGAVFPRGRFRILSRSRWRPKITMSSARGRVGEDGSGRGAAQVGKIGRTYDRTMQAWVEVPDEWGWGPIRMLRGRLEDNGYHTSEYRMVRGVMIHVTGSKPSELADSSRMAWPF